MLFMRIARGVGLSSVVMVCSGSSAAIAQGREPPPLKPPLASFEPRTLTADNIDAFLLWAARTPRAYKDRVRLQIARATGKSAIAQQLAKLYPQLVKEDFDLALIALSVAGELRTRAATPFLKEVLFAPLPQSDKLDDPGLTRRESIELLQAKAVQGLAYLQDAEADQAVLTAIKSHPSRAVRSAAIEALLYNAKDPVAARRQLLDVVAENDRVLLDLTRRTQTQDVAEFNRRMEEFYARHPDQRPKEPGEPREPAQPDDTSPAKDEHLTPKTNR